MLLKTLKKRNLAFLFLFTAYITISAQVTSVGSETIINTTTTASQQNPSVALDSSGNYVIVWESLNQDGNGWGIYGQRYNNTGAVVGSEFLVNTTTTNDQRFPDVAMDKLGNFVVTWMSLNQDGDGWGVYHQRYTSAGSATGGENRVATATANHQRNPSVSMNYSGTYVISWSDIEIDGSAYLVNAKSYNANGSTAISDFQVNSSTVSSIAYPKAAINNKGEFVITWQTNDLDGSGMGVYARRYNSSGVAQGTDFLANTTTTDNQQSPDISIDTAGNFVIVWESYGQDGDREGIYAQRFNSSGVAQGSEFIVNTTTTGAQKEPSIDLTISQNITIAWSSYGEDGSFGGVYLQQFDDLGVTVGSAVKVNTNSTNHQQFPSVSTTSNGNLVVAWQDGLNNSTSTNDGSNYGVYSQIYNVSPPLTAFISEQTNITCFGLSNGSLTASAISGSPNYTFVWSNSSTSGSTADTSHTITGLAPGTYTVTITDNNGSTAIASETITQPTALSASSSINSNVSCNGLSDGSATASAIGGTSPYSFTWSNSATTASITGLSAGTYTVTVSDANLCTNTSNVTITEPAALSANTTTNSNVSCNGLSDGSTTASATGGTSPYSFSWSNAATTAAITGLSAGTYTVTVSDANSCTNTSSITITEAAALSASSLVNGNVSCNGLSDGSVTASATGGTSPYSFAWSNSATTAAITGLSAGAYTVTVTDGNSCTNTSSIMITQPSAIIASSLVNSNVSCNGLSDGSATASATGGTSPYSFTWSNSATTAAITGLSAGTYTVTVSDANSCTNTSSVTITQPSALSASSLINGNVSCNGLSDGSATASVTGGTSPYSFTWSNSATTAAITGLSAGTYTVTVSDANSCTNTSSVTITQPSAIVASSIVNGNVSCNGLSDGSATASATGGTSPYSFTWSNSATTAAITGLSAGTYTVTVSDANSCTNTSSITITEPLILTSTVTVTECGSYTWTQNSMTYFISGMYNDTIQNALGCDSIITLDLTINNSTASTVIITECDSYTWMQNSMMYTVSGIYIDTTQNALGCDSVITLDLTINSSTASTVTVAECDNFTWMQNNITYSVSGMYNDTILNTIGCDSVITLDLTINNSTASTVTVTECGSYTWMQNNMMYTVSGIYTDTILNTIGCDSVITLDLTINNSTVSTVTITECDSYTWMQNNTMYTVSGIYTDTIPNTMGCDSILTLDLTVTTSSLSSVSDTACDSYTWLQNNITYTTSGAYPDTISNALGCDSVVTLNLFLSNSNSATVSDTACNSYTWAQNNLTYTTSGAYIDTVRNSAGCDSIVTLNLIINNSPTVTSFARSCSNFTWLQNNQTYTSTGIYRDTVAASIGCDSIFILDLTIDNVDLSITTDTTSLTVAQTGATYQWIDCANGDTAITGATSQSYTAIANGSYAVVVTLNSCSDTSACVGITSVGIDNNLSSANIKLYPNPTTELVTLENNSDQLLDRVIVRNTIGQVVSTINNFIGQKQTIELHGERGIYLIEVISKSGESKLFKVIKY